MTRILVAAAVALAAAGCGDPLAPSVEPQTVTLALLVTHNATGQPVVGAAVRLEQRHESGTATQLRDRAVQRTGPDGRVAWQVRAGFRYLLWVDDEPHFGHLVTGDTQWLLGLP